MKNNFLLATLVACVNCLYVQAQNEPVKFQVSLATGIAAGSSEPQWIIQTVNGLSSGKWFTGIGAGLDHYEYRTLPLFADVRRYFGKHDEAFVYGDIGYNFAWKTKPGKEIGYYDEYSFSGGLYTDVGIGYRFVSGKKSALNFTIGHSYKELTANTGTTICPFIGPCYTQTDKYRLNFVRIVIRAGVIF